MDFLEHDEWAGEEDPLRFHIAGTVYEVDPPDHRTGLYVQREWYGAIEKAAGGQDLDTADGIQIMRQLSDEDSYRRLLGGTYDAMVDDRVPTEAIRCAAMTIVIRIIAGDEAAAEYWKTRGKGRPRRAQPQDRKRAGGNRATTHKAAAPTTRRLASTSGTTPADPEEEDAA